MAEELAGREKFGPIFDKLGVMVGAARDAFNRHSKSSLEHLKKAHQELTPEIKSAMEEFGNLAAVARCVGIGNIMTSHVHSSLKSEHS